MGEVLKRYCFKHGVYTICAESDECSLCENAKIEIVENVIIGSAIRDLIDAGYTVKTEDHDGSLWLAAFDTEKITPKTKAAGWARLVWGNGPDMLSDYSTNLESVLANTIKLSE